MIPASEYRNGQQWLSPKPRCYMCQSFQSNMPMTGRCSIGAKEGAICSHDLMTGDGCFKFNPKYPEFHKGEYQ